jgi:hypothetical protein
VDQTNSSEIVRDGAGDDVSAASSWIPEEPEPPRLAQRGDGGRTRWWGTALLALVFIALGFGMGWILGSIWYTGNGAADSHPEAAEDTIVEVFMSGDAVVVSLEDAGPLALKDSPNGTTVALLEDGTELEVLSGPRTSGGGRWYRVEVTDAGFTGHVRLGYVAAEYIKLY